MSMNEAERWRELGQQLRVDSVRVSAKAGSGHPTSSMSAADLMAVLLDGYLRMDTSNLDNPSNDHLIYSKGHASPLYYSVLKAAGIIGDEEFMTFRELNSRLEGHPTPRIPPTDVATGSLGQTRETMLGWDMEGYADRVRAFGCHPIICDGLDVDAVDAAYQEALSTKGKP